MFEEFREFAMRGNVVDMAVGIIIGGAFGAIIASLVSDVLMPPIGLLLGNVDVANLFITIKSGSTAGPYLKLAEAQQSAAITINYGIFLNKIISFIIVAFSVFFVVRAMNSMRRKEEAPPAAPTTKDCPRCFTTISLKATSCPNCTSEIS